MITFINMTTLIQKRRGRRTLVLVYRTVKIPKQQFVRFRFSYSNKTYYFLENFWMCPISQKIVGPVLHPDSNFWVSEQGPDCIPAP